MPQLDTTAESSAKHILVYGPPKSGKSLLVGKLAEHFNLIWFDLESGHDVLYQLPKEHQKRIQLIPIPDTSDYPIAIETCLKVIRGGPGWVCSEHGKVDCPRCIDRSNKNDIKPKEGNIADFVELSKTPLDTVVVFDSLTQLTNSGIANISKDHGDNYKLNYDDWAKLGRLMDTFLGFVQVAPCHVVCISHESMVETEDKKEKIVPVAGTRNFSRNSAKYFGEVIYCEVKNKKHQFGSGTTYKMDTLTGSRHGLKLEDGDSLSNLFITKSK